MVVVVVVVVVVVLAVVVVVAQAFIKGNPEQTTVVELILFTI